MKILTFILFFTFSVSAQEAEKDMRLSLRLINKCFDDLQPMKFIAENSGWKDSDICNLATCSVLLIAKEPEAKEELKNRIIEITRKLYANGTPIKLISGLDSVEYAEKLNENLTDDNGIVYISIASCVSTNEDRITKEIVNNETDKLLKLK